MAVVQGVFRKRDVVQSVKLTVEALKSGDTSVLVEAMEEEEWMRSEICACL